MRYTCSYKTIVPPFSKPRHSIQLNLCKLILSLFRKAKKIMLLFDKRDSTALNHGNFFRHCFSGDSFGDSPLGATPSSKGPPWSPAVYFLVPCVGMMLGTSTWWLYGRKLLISIKFQRGEVWVNAAFGRILLSLAGRFFAVRSVSMQTEFAVPWIIPCNEMIETE